VVVEGDKETDKVDEHVKRYSNKFIPDIIAI
jgi:hypothetical protein